jgi:hypothetical protein
MGGDAMLTAVKPPRCKHCRKQTESIHQRIHPDCVDAWWEARNAKQQAKKEKADRADTKARKEAIKTIPQLIKEAQVEFNAYIRERDKDKPCISCGICNPPMMPGGQWDAGHFLSRGAYPELRFDEDNCHKQCKSCNGGGGKFAHKARTVSEQYERNLPRRIGQERFERLTGPHELVKWDRDTLRQIKVIYRAKVRTLKKEEHEIPQEASSHRRYPVVPAG